MCKSCKMHDVEWVSDTKRSSKPIVSWQRIHRIFLLAVLAVVSLTHQQIQIRAESKKLASVGEERTVELDYRQQRIINQTLLRDADACLLLERMENLLAEKRLLEAAELFQQLCDHPHDTFVWDQGRPASLRQLAIKNLERHPQLWSVYENLFGAVSRQLLQENNPEARSEVARRYFCTQAGFDAVSALADEAWDQADWDLCLQWWTLLQRSPIHCRSLSPGQLARMNLLTDRQDAEHVPSVNFPTREISAVNAAMQRLRYEKNIWSLAGDGTTRKSYTQQSAPMPEPIWAHPLQLFADEKSLSEDSELLRTSLEQWSAQQHEQLIPELTSLQAVVAGEVLVYRDIDSIVALPTSGSGLSSQVTSSDCKQPLWRHSCVTPLMSAIQYEQDPFTGVSSNHPSLERLYLTNSVIGAITTDGQRVFAIDQIERLSCEYAPRTASSGAAEIQAATGENQQVNDHILSNRLMALSLEKMPQAGGRSESQQLAWSIDQRGLYSVLTAEHSPHPLQKHFLLGPPVIEGQRGYLLSEYDSTMYLSAIKPETGVSLWSVPICYLDRSLENDVVRATRACMPVCSQGMIFCENGNGQLIVVDESSGQLMWTYCYADEDSRQDSGRWTYTQSTRVTQAGVLNLPIVRGDYVLLMPDRSLALHCCERQTGNLIWKQPRGDAEYLVDVFCPQDSDQLGEASDLTEMVLLLGARHCRSINIQSGQTNWESHLGFISGRGAQVGHHYLVPVSDPGKFISVDDQAFQSHGQIAAISLIDGQPAGQLMGPNSHNWNGAERIHATNRYAFPLGNLLATNDLVFSIGINQIIGFCQASRVVQELAEQQLKKELSASELRQLAQAELVLGQPQQAREHLEKAKTIPAAPVEHQQILAMYRELLYRELWRESVTENSYDDQDILAELDNLSQESDEQKARFLIAKIELLSSRGKYQQLWSATEEFAKIGINVPVSSVRERGYFSTSASWMTGMYDQIHRALTPQEKQTWLQQIESNWLAQLPERSDSQLLTFLETFTEPRLPISVSSSRFVNLAGESEAIQQSRQEFHAIRDIVRLELIVRAFANGQLQQAENLLLALSQSAHPESRALGLQGLVKLYSQLGIHHQTGNFLIKLQQENHDHHRHRDSPEWQRLVKYLQRPKAEEATEQVAVVGHQQIEREPNWLYKRDFFNHFDLLDTGWLEYQKSMQVAGSIEKIKIETAYDLPMVNHDPYAKRRCLQTLSQHRWALLQQTEGIQQRATSESEVDTGPSHDHQHLILLDRYSGQELLTLAMPGQRVGLPNIVHPDNGHFLPLAVDGNVYGVSLLEGKPIWTRVEQQLENLTASPNGQWQIMSDGVTRDRSQENQKDTQRPRRVELGPTGPGYCILQTSRALFAIDPLEGRLLWKRTDLDPQGGLWSDRNTGLLGDEHVLVYFQPNQKQYVLLETLTGEKLKTGELEADSQQIQRTRQAFGRQLMYLTVSTTGTHERKIKLWDPLSEKLPIDESFSAGDLYHVSPDELTLLLGESRLLIYRPHEQKSVVDLELTGITSARANYLRVIRQGPRYFVNLYQTQRIEGEEGYPSRYTDAPWNLTHINGPVICVNQDSGELEWTRQFANRSVVEEPGCQLPFLLMLANYQARPGDHERTLLMELVEARSGETLLIQQDLPQSRFLILNHNPQTEEIRLSGLSEELVVTYHSAQVKGPEMELVDPLALGR